MIIFTTLRESVNSIVALLKRKQPLITPRSAFVESKSRMPWTFAFQLQSVMTWHSSGGMHRGLATAASIFDPMAISWLS